MAALKCPVHGPQVNTDEPLCPVCMEFLVPDVEPATAQPTNDDIAVCPEPGCGTPLTDGRCSVHSLGVGPQPRMTRRDGGSARVLFPWGTVDIDRDELWIGRSPGSAVASHIGDYDNISRLHAVFLRKDGEVFVRDQGSMNGTFVNERRLEPQSPHRLSHGDVIRFAADLRATIELPGRSR